VLAHSDVAPGRKIDPGEKFPWRRLAEEGVGLFVEPAKGNDGPTIGLGSSGRAVEELQAMLARYGYGIEVSGRYEQKTQSIVAAFQRHFRPQRVDGIADGGTMATLRKLLSALDAERTAGDHDVSYSNTGCNQN
jgi:N-acetylmuramoyl-L-alanine amidase